MYYDDLLLVQFPPLPVNMSTTVVGNDIEFSFPTQEGVTYQVASKAALSDPSWTPVENVLGDGNVVTRTYAMNGSRQFYIVLIP